MGGRVLSFVCVVLLTIGTLANAAPLRLSGDCIDSATRSSFATLFPAASSFELDVTDARLFDVQYFATHKLVTNTHADERYILYQCGAYETPPTSEELGHPAGIKVFEVPLQSASVPDATAAAFMRELGVADRVAFVTRLSVPACYQALASTCGLSALAHDSPDITSNDAVGAVFDFVAHPDNPKAVAFPATADTSPLARAEWLKYMAMFFNKEHEANEQFGIISGSYNRIAATAAAAAAAAAAAGGAKRIAWVQWWPAKPEWGLPNEPTIQIAWPDYKRKITVAAGAKIVDSDDLKLYSASGDVVDYFGWPGAPSTGTFLLASNSDLLREILRDVDVVIDEARYDDIDGDASDGDVSDAGIDLEAFMDRYGLDSPTDVFDLAFLRGNGLLRVDGLTSAASWTEWFGVMVVRPDQVLADLVSALWPLVPMPTKPLFLRNVARGQAATLVSETECQLTGCRLPQSEICPHVYLACDGTPVAAVLGRRCAPECDFVFPGDDYDSKLSSQALRPSVLLAVSFVFIACVFLSLAGNTR